ncbi:MAG: tRNA lysidine(34) synthetase TilS [Chloroflexi bacterium]|nr:tRNA lysidine(34) synthetase TilS [Chloroflexota bacterium]
MTTATDLAISYLQPGILITVGVSGGPDSMALLHFLHTLHYPLLIASFNHRLRPGAEQDIDYVRQFAANLGLPFVSGSADVAAHASSHGLSVEEAARDLRYQFLFGEARKAGAQAVVVGHTADDQAETVLMHFLRGAGLTGLKGMPPRTILASFDESIPLVRPLLAWTRADTEAYCNLHDLKPRLDPTNTDTKYFRNKLRYELLPILEKYNPQIKQSLARTALALQGDYELLNGLIETAWQKTVRSTGPGFIEFDRLELAKLAATLTRNLFRKAAFKLKPGLRDIDFDALERAATLKPVELAGGLKTFLEGDRLYLTADQTCLPTTSWPQLSEPIFISAGLASLGNGWFLHAQEITSDNLYAEASSNPQKYTAWLDADLTSDQVMARTFHSGDRFEPLGMPRQSIKLAELFINLKIHQRLRRNWPLICVNDIIAWVPGLRLAESFKVTEKTRRAIKIEFRKELGSA